MEGVVQVFGVPGVKTACERSNIAMSFGGALKQAEGVWNVTYAMLVDVSSAVTSGSASLGAAC